MTRNRMSIESEHDIVLLRYGAVHAKACADCASKIDNMAQNSSGVPRRNSGVDQK
jgi:hypothetical protein